MDEDRAMEELLLELGDERPIGLALGDRDEIEFPLRDFMARRRIDGIGLFPLITAVPALQQIAMAAPSSPPPSELYALLEKKDWAAAIERCRTHPEEVSSKLRGDRGYTALHCLLAYNQTMDGEELVPLITAILTAAEEADFRAEFPLGRIAYDDVYHMKQFYADIETVKSDIAFLESTTEQLLNALNNDKASLTPFTTGASKINYRIENCKKKLESLEEENIQIKKELSEEEEKERKRYTDDLDVRENLVSKLQSQFNDESKRFEKAQEQLFCTIDDADLKASSERKTGGSLRLLLDQHNGAKWSPLHILCLNGGFSQGKVSLLQALLKGHQDASHQLLSLLDRQNRNLLHHVVEISVPTEDTFRAVHYIICQEYSVLHQKDDRGKIPLDYVYQRHSLNSNFGTSSMTEERYVNNLKLMKILIGYSDRDEEKAVERRDDANGQLIDNDDIIPQNMFHSICRLHTDACPQGIFSSLFKDSSDEKKIDENGNTPLHILLGNTSYIARRNTFQNQVHRGNNRISYLSNREFRFVLASNRDTVRVRNNDGNLPLRIAMNARWKLDIVRDLVMANPQAVLLDKTLEESPKLMPHVLGLVASSNGTLDPDTDPKIVDKVVKPLDTMFELIRGRPAIVAFGELGSAASSTYEAKPK